MKPIILKRKFNNKTIKNKKFKLKRKSSTKNRSLFKKQNTKSKIRKKKLNSLRTKSIKKKKNKIGGSCQAVQNYKPIQSAAWNCRDCYNNDNFYSLAVPDYSIF